MVHGKLHHNGEQVVLCSMSWKTLLVVLVVWSTSLETKAQAGQTVANVEFYFNSNLGISLVDVVWPGASILGECAKCQNQVSCSKLKLDWLRPPL